MNIAYGIMIVDMFKFGKKDKTSKAEKDEKKKERKDSKKDKSRSSFISSELPEDERYSRPPGPPPVAPKPNKTSSLNVALSGKPTTSGSTRSILKLRGSSKRKEHLARTTAALDDSFQLRENTRINEEMSGQAMVTAPDHPSYRAKDRSRESIHSITMNILPPSVPPPSSPTEKIYSVNLELPRVSPPASLPVRELAIRRRPAGDFGFSLKRAQYISADGKSHDAVFGEPGAAHTPIRMGDRIIEVNGVNTETATREEVVALIHRSGDELGVKVQAVPEVMELRSCIDNNIYENGVNGHNEVSV